MVCTFPPAPSLCIFLQQKIKQKTHPALANIWQMEACHLFFISGAPKAFLAGTDHPSICHIVSVTGIKYSFLQPNPSFLRKAGMKLTEGLEAPDFYNILLP